MDDPQIEHMVQRFLQWPLPVDFGPDNGVAFDRSRVPPGGWPVGTNLFSYSQARTMVENMLEGLPAAASTAAAGDKWGTLTTAIADAFARDDEAAAMSAGRTLLAEFGRTLDRIADGRASPVLARAATMPLSGVWPASYRKD